MFTNNIAEFGAPLPAVALAGEALGLHWLTVTDHSCDLDETGDGTWSYATHEWEYTLQTPDGIATHYRNGQEGGSSWSGLGADVTLLDSPAFRLYRGVEINLASVDADSWERTLHCLFYNPAYIHSPYCGAIGERPVSPSLPDGLAQLDPLGFAYAAHPANDLGGEGGIDITVNGALWGDEDLATALGFEGFRGIQAFNTRHTLYSSDQNNPWPDFDAGEAYTESDAYPDELLQGVALWDDLLLDGLSADPPRTVFFAGGSDAHGDLNYATYLGFDTYATDSAIGKAQTVVHVPGGYAPGNLPPMDDLLTSYRAGHSVVSDGPFIEIGLDRDDDGNWYEAEDLAIGEQGATIFGEPLPLKLRWASLPEFGVVTSVRLLIGGEGGVQELLSINPQASGQGLGGDTSIELSGFGFENWRYLRAECLTSDGHVGHRAYTNPIWLDFEDGTGVAPGDHPVALRLHGNYPNPFNPTTTISFDLPRAAEVELTVLDTRGRQVAVLLAGRRQAGAHSVTWRAEDRDGMPLAAGIYLCSLRVAGDRQVGKMLLVK
ncbi:MAG: hypothetical protein GY835_01555 [bacterium]|nr:hypothetical protein [bacterium]